MFPAIIAAVTRRKTIRRRLGIIEGRPDIIEGHPGIIEGCPGIIEGRPGIAGEGWAPLVVS